jgi:hypothetical protein
MCMTLITLGANVLLINKEGKTVGNIARDSKWWFNDYDGDDDYDDYDDDNYDDNDDDYDDDDDNDDNDDDD